MCTQQWVLVQVSTPSKNCQKVDSLKTFRLLQRLFIRLYKQRNQTGLRDAQWIVWRGSPQLFRVRSVVERCLRYSLDVEQLFTIFLPYARIYCDSQYLKNCLQCVWFLLMLSICPLFMGSSGSTKKLHRIFWEKLSRKYGFLRKNFCFQIRNCLLNPLVVNFWNLAALETAFLEQWLASVDFWADKSFFEIIFAGKEELPWTSAAIYIGCSLPNLSRFCYTLYDNA